METVRTFVVERSFKYRDYEVLKLSDKVEVPVKNLDIKLGEKVMSLMEINIELTYLKLKPVIDEAVKLGMNPEEAIAMLEEAKFNTQEEVKALLGNVQD